MNCKLCSSPLAEMRLQDLNTFSYFMCCAITVSTLSYFPSCCSSSAMRASRRCSRAAGVPTGLRRCTSAPSMPIALIAFWNACSRSTSTRIQLVTVQGIRACSDRPYQRILDLGDCCVLEQTIMTQPPSRKFGSLATLVHLSSAEHISPIIAAAEVAAE